MKSVEILLDSLGNQGSWSMVKKNIHTATTVLRKTENQYSCKM